MADIKEINGLKHYVNTSYRDLSYSSRETKDKFIADGWTECNGGYYSKDFYEPVYHSQLSKEDCRCIGEEPRYSNYSVHTPQTHTIYFSVPRKAFENMKVKPELKEQCRPARFHNFDGFTEQIQKEKKAMGWEETDNITYHLTYRRIFFVED